MLSQFLNSTQQDLLDLSSVESHFTTKLQKPANKKTMKNTFHFYLAFVYTNQTKRPGLPTKNHLRQNGTPNKISRPKALNLYELLGSGALSPLRGIPGGFNLHSLRKLQYLGLAK